MSIARWARRSTGSASSNPQVPVISVSRRIASS
ncbi:hypothetical protein HNR23_002956 [Nocardiopsis mwathae]|uniref:Uncharacterized protein n=1 Tax=Nocardiopsis mwathae TaxID=1472723 RepID=A0A7X0D6M9_9ACTN|nr:hypothetical protein [Nocardiopsis mwathae]